MTAAHSHYATVERAIRYLTEHQVDQPGLTELAQATGLSGTHLQRVFTEWAGISPKRFLQVITKNAARQRLLDPADGRARLYILQPVRCRLS